MSVSVEDRLTDFYKLTRALEILTPHVSIRWPNITAEHDQIWLHFGHDYINDSESPQVEFDEDAGESVLHDPSPLTMEEAMEMAAMGFFVDSEVGAWSMFT